MSLTILVMWIKAAVEGSTSMSDESDLMDFDNEVAQSFAHLDASSHFIHRSILIPCSLVSYITTTFCSYGV